MEFELGQQLNALLPELRQNRTNWPLWTYDREPWGEARCPWLDRWRFSGSFLISGFLEERDRKMPGYWAEAAIILVAHQTALAIPNTLSSEVVGDLLDVGVLDRPDASAFVTDVVEVLNNDLFLRMLDCARAVASGSDHAPRETPGALAQELCRRVGLLPRQKRLSTGLDNETLRGLDREARGIVDAVRRDGGVKLSACGWRTWTSRPASCACGGRRPRRPSVPCRSRAKWSGSCAGG